MTSWVIVERASTADGDELLLRERNGAFELRMNGRELMATRAYGSEQEMARLACRQLRLAKRPRVLIGGLGMGFTLRAALDVLPRSARVLVVELVPELVEWGRGRLAAAAAAPLSDPRVTIRIGDVKQILDQSDTQFHAILLDVDNGPDAPVRRQNRGVFAPGGLALIRRALRERGALAVWSADPCRSFLHVLRDNGFRPRRVEAPALGRRGGPLHTIFLATRRPAHRSSP
jgi:spermidine synthase